MIVVLSDLHFSEAQSTQIGLHRFDRNLPPEVYHAYFAEINQFAAENKIHTVDLVLAGDILEISRSAIWLQEKDRPYINNDDVTPDSQVEKTILKIIKAIAAEEDVARTLALFRGIQSHFTINVKLHIVLGNHDRLVNATPKIRAEVRKLFGIEDGATPFHHYLVMEDDEDKPFCLIRHGHEYDPTNFSLDVRKLETIPTHIEKKFYSQAVLGDIMTIEYGTSLPWLFVKEYGEEAIIESKTLTALYQRLMEFDDVRPTTAWLAYLFSTPGVKKKKTWQLMKPCFTQVINNLSRHELFNETLKQSTAMSPVVRTILLALIRSGVFRKGIPYWLMKMLMKRVSQSIKLVSQSKWARREALIKDAHSGCKCVISGHTHFAEVSLLSAKKGDDRYYINTGTWRNVIPATKNYQEFGRLKSLTKVVVFYPGEKPELLKGSTWAFHYLSGVSFGDDRLV